MKLLSLIICLGLISCLKAQVFWTETFNNGCSSGCLANGVNTGNGAWSVVSLAGDASPFTDYPNQWYVSCAENGHTNTVCGSGCVALSSLNTLASLHVGSTSSGDIGAAYDAGGLCGFFYCTNTHKQVISPNISTAGKTSITLSFDYIEFGQTTNDDMYAVQYSTNGGSTWTTLSNPAKTTCCGGSCNGSLQGKWTTYTSVTLPVAAENISNFKISFIWKNNDDGLGTDPSFAVDNIKLQTPVALPVELSNFSYKAGNNSTLLKWETQSEINTDYFEILRSGDGFSFDPIGTVKGSGSRDRITNYSFSDDHIFNSIVYYKLKIVDKDGNFKYSAMIAVDADNLLNSRNNCFLNDNEQIEVGMDYVLVNGFESAFIYNMEGRLLKNYALKEFISDGRIAIPTESLQQGIYMVQLRGSSSVKCHKIFVP